MPANSPFDKGNFSFMQKGGKEAFEALYKEYWYKLYCIARKQTHSPEDAEELVQALFEKIWKGREELKVNHWGAYLVVSLRNMIIDFHRQQAQKAKFLQRFDTPADLPTPADHPTPEEELDQQQLLNAIDNVLGELPEKTQTIFKLSRYEHKSVKEIAGSMHLTEKAVEYHITKSIKLLRHHLRNYLNFFLTLF